MLLNLTESFYVKDGLGSIRALTNASGNVTDTYTYDAFGNLIGSTGSTVNNYRYRGEQYDPNVGEYYLRARYYEPETGRFTATDPFSGVLTEPMSLTKYDYAKENPINSIDPSGRVGIGDGASALAISAALDAEAVPSFFGWLSSNLSLSLPDVFPTAVTETVPEIANLGRATISIAERIAWEVVKTTVTIGALVGEAIEDENLEGIPAVVWGNDIPQSTQHTFDALTGTNQTGFKDGWGLASPFLGHVDKWSQKRQWLNNVIPMNLKGTGLSRDEYPYNATIPGGPIFYELHAVSVRLAPRYEGERQSKRLDEFYQENEIEKYDPDKMWFIVGTTKESNSFYIDRNNDPQPFIEPI